MHLRKPSPATVIASAALFFALGGTAIAAHHYLITKPGQIKPSVLAKLKGKSGPSGATGPAGPQGPGGGTAATGKEGPPGATGVLSSGYLDEYDASSQIIASGAPATFPTAVVPPVGIIPNTEATRFTVSGGTYLVTLTLPGGASHEYQLEVNGLAVGPQSTGTIGLSRIVQASAGTAISVVSTAGISNSFPAASEITIVRIA